MDSAVVEGDAGTNPFRHFALRNASPPFCRLAGEGGRTLSVSLRSTALPKGEPLAEPESFVLPSSTAGRSQPISGKLYALAKASPFRERWHGEAVPERVAFGENPLSLAALDSSPEGESPWQNQQVSSTPVNGRRSQPINP